MPKASRNQSKYHLRAKPPLQRGAYQRLAREIHRRADELGLTVRALAARLGKARTTVHKTLSGQRRLDPIEFLEWCEALEWKDPLAIIESVRHS